MTALPVVAIVGRPNVGKSTLLNRIVGRREAIVEEKPGVTRDRKEVEAEWQGRAFRLVDTGGWMPGGDALDAKVSAQSEQAIAEADAVLLRGRRHRRRSPRRTAGSPRSAAPRRHARCCWWPTRSTTPTARPAPGSSCRLGLGDPYPGQRPARPGHRRPARRPRRALLPEPAPEVEPTSSEPEDGGRRGLLGGHRGSAQRGQVHAVQPPDRRRPLRRARHARHHPRHGRHRRRDPRRPGALRRHRRHAPPEPRSTRAPSTTRWSGPCRPSTWPTWPCW